MGFTLYRDCDLVSHQPYRPVPPLNQDKPPLVTLSNIYTHNHMQSCLFSANISIFPVLFFNYCDDYSSFHMSGTLTLNSTLTRYRATLVHFRYNIPGVPPNRVDSKRTDGTLFAQTMSFYCDFQMETSWLLFWDIGLESPAFFTPYSIDKKRSCHS